jgi:hypothetical protein
MAKHFFLFFLIFLLLFICAYKAWFISTPGPHPLPYHQSISHPNILYALPQDVRGHVSRSENFHSLAWSCASLSPSVFHHVRMGSLVQVPLRDVE